MKQRELIKKLEAIDFRFLRNGGEHMIYTNGQCFEFIPRHKDIDERMARKILKKYGLLRAANKTLPKLQRVCA